MLQRVSSSALYWLADEVGSLTPRRLRPGDLSLCYTPCHIPSICFGRSPPRSLSCTAILDFVMDQIVWGNLLEGLQEVVWAANLVGWAH
jgi:hypothetical protein